MFLPGRLGLTTLGDLLGAMYREGMTGVLELTEATGPHAGRTHRIRLAAGFVASVETAISAPRLGELLGRRGAVSRGALEQLPARLLRFPSRRAGELLVASGDATPSAVEAALADQRKEQLDRLFELTDARVAFRVARGQGALSLEPLGPTEFLHGRERHRDREAETTPRGKRHDPSRARALSTLGLSAAADVAEVQRAFRTLASRLHPDRFPTASPEERRELLRRFAAVSAAYHALVA